VICSYGEKQMIKKRHLFVQVVIIALLSVSILFISGVTSFPQKTHMANASERFNFHRYCQPSEMGAALKSLFPRGTSREFVEKKLVEEGKAVIKNDDFNPKVFHYFGKVVCNPEDTQWWVNVSYDSQDTVRQITYTGGSDIFPRTPPENRTDGVIFRFEDYSSVEDMAKTLHALFPLGAARTDVERVLVKWARSDAFVQNNEPHHVLYNYRINNFIQEADKSWINNPHVWNILIIYNPDDTVALISVDSSTAVQAFEPKESGNYLHNRIKKTQ
jgi:hypothetical protein